jgi:putative protease
LSRGFTHGFLSGVNHQKLVTARFPKSRGIRIGTVARVLPNRLLLNLDGRTSLKPGDGVVFDEGHPEQDEQGGRVFAVHPRGRQIEIELGRGDVNLSAINPGAIVWKTDDPALRKRLEHSFSRDAVVNRRPLDVRVFAHVGMKLRIAFTERDESVEVEWDKPLEAAQKFPLTGALIREQLGRLGDTPYELRDVELDLCGGPMAPKSVLNDLRRDAVTRLLESRRARGVAAVESSDALEELRRNLPLPAGQGEGQGALYALTRSLDQLSAVLAWRVESAPTMVYCDFEDIRRYKEAVAMAREANVPIALATLRIVKPHEEGLLRQILDCQPDALLVRNLAAVSFYHEHAPGIPMIGDYSLNISNELTAGIFNNACVMRMVPSYDLSWRQLSAMLVRFDPARFECVVHQHMPMFHMEHCVFAHTLSNGKDFHDCGRPCNRHRVDLRDRVGQPHPLIADVGCRNTVFNAQAQSAAEYIPKMLQLGVRHFRVELLREQGDEVTALLDRYAGVIQGKSDPRAALRSLRVINQLGVTAGTLDRE